MRGARLVLALLCVASIALGTALMARAELQEAPAHTLTVLEEKLANGLHVIVAPDPAVSSVVVHVRYGGGAADEDAAHAGYSHLVERLLGAGSVHVKPGELDERIDAAGGFASSVTAADHLSVFEQVPAGALELALWLEAERMAGLADGIRDDELAKAKEALAAEYRAAYQEQPYALVDRAVREALWAGEPNAHDVLGDGRALAGATGASVRAFVKERIDPANATIVITGRIDGESALGLARRYFAWIPARRPAVAVRTDRELVPLAKPVERTVPDPVSKVVVAYRAGLADSATVTELDVVAHVLAGRRRSLLSRALVDSSFATEVHAEVLRAAQGAELRITAVAGFGTDPAQIGATIRAEVAALGRANQVSSDELRAATLSARQELIGAIENLAFRADALASWEAYLGEANHFDIQLERLGVVGEPELSATARRWLASTSAVTIVGRPEQAP